MSHCSEAGHSSTRIIKKTITYHNVTIIMSHCHIVTAGSLCASTRINASLAGGAVTARTTAGTHRTKCTIEGERVQSKFANYYLLFFGKIKMF